MKAEAMKTRGRRGRQTRLRKATIPGPRTDLLNGREQAII